MQVRGNHREEIRKGIETAVSAQFRYSLSDMSNPYGNGHAAEVIIDVLKQVELDDALLQKHFHEM